MRLINSISLMPITHKVIPVSDAAATQVMSSSAKTILSGADTNGTFFLSEVCDVPGGGVPPHMHTKEDETFHILEGEVEFLMNGETLVSKPGTVVFAPRGSVHAFKPLTPIRMMVYISPAGLEKMFAELSRVGPTDPPARITEICGRYGISFV